MCIAKKKNHDAIRNTWGVLAKVGIKLVLYIVSIAFVFPGCVAPIQEPRPICPGAESAVQALSILNAASQRSVPLRATGQCRIDYFDEAGKPKTENFPVRLWMEPPAHIYLLGDIFLVPAGIVLGSNNDEFWLLIKPKEISTYFWGSWATAGSVENLIINPKAVMEAIGIPLLGDTSSWILSKQGNFDVLTEHDEAGRTVRKIYIDSCDFRIRKIEYFNAQQQLVVVTELDKYKQVLEKFFIPADVKITEYSSRQAGNSVEIRFDSDSIRPATFSQKVRDWMFKQPSQEGFEKGYEIVNGEIVKRW